MIGRSFSAFSNPPVTPDMVAARFNDPVAHKTEWVPLGKGGSNFCSHKLISSGQDIMKFVPTFGLLAFSFIFLAAGLILLVAIGFSLSDTVPFLLGFIFAAVGALMLYFSTIPRVFDRSAGLYYKNRKAPADSSVDNKNAALLNNIHALQLLKRLSRGDRRYYYTYELNLILQDGERVAVMSHGSRVRLREDARTLSGFLGKPVWDAIDYI